MSRLIPCWGGSVVSMYASHDVGHWFATLPGHTKDNYENGTNRLPACHAGE